MIKTLVKLIIVACIAFAGFTWWTTDDKVITRKTEALIGFFIKGPGDVDFGEGTRTKAFTDFLDKEVTFQYDREDTPKANFLNELGDQHGKDQLIAAHSRLSASEAILVIKDPKINIVEIDKTIKIEDQPDLKAIAKVEVEFDLNCKYDSNREYTKSMTCDLIFTKIKSEWNIRSINLKQNPAPVKKQKSERASGLSDAPSALSDKRSNKKSNKKTGLQSGFTNER